MRDIRSTDYHTRTSARLALRTSSGQLGPDQALTHDSIVGTRLLGRVVGTL